MAKVVDITAYRSRAFQQRAFGPWERRFKESFRLETRYGDLTDKTLYRLAALGGDNAVPFYELIMGALDLGRAEEFHFLDDEQKMRVVDVHLFLADHVRFEIMRRLGWVESFPGQAYALIEMVQNFGAVQAACRHSPPVLSASHPGYDDYRQLITREKEVFIRRLLQDALEAFKTSRNL